MEMVHLASGARTSGESLKLCRLLKLELRSLRVHLRGSFSHLFDQIHHFPNPRMALCCLNPVPLKISPRPILDLHMPL